MFQHLATLNVIDAKTAKRLWDAFFGIRSAHGRVGSTRRDRSGISMTPNGVRECARRRRQNADLNQIKSHPPGTLWPFHLGARPTSDEVAS